MKLPACSVYAAVITADYEFYLDISEVDRLLTLIDSNSCNLIEFKGRWGQDLYLKPTDVTGISVWHKKAAENYMESKNEANINGEFSE